MKQQFGPIALARLMFCAPFMVMLVLMLIEASLSAATTYLVIEAGRDVARGMFLLADLMWILAAQSAAYIVGAVSWIFAERTGFLAYGRYMMRFARDNRHKTKLLGDKEARERVEPFLTGETFYVYFHLLYEIEGDLRILLALILNVIVLGTQIDGALPVAYAAVFVVLFLMQWTMRKRVAGAYRENQRMTNRMTAQGYTAWDNVFAGNRYHLRLWLAGFKERLREALRAQIVAIMWREGLSSMSGILGLAVIFVAIVLVAIRNAGDTEMLVVLAATLPRQIEMTKDMYSLAAGWNDMVAVWARIGGVVENMDPDADPNYNARMRFDRIMLREGDQQMTAASLDEALSLVFSKKTGRINVRGGNGSGKSTMLAALKAEIKNKAYYWPTPDRLAFKFAEGVDPEGIEVDDVDPELLEELGEEAKAPPPKKIGFSS